MMSSRPASSRPSARSHHRVAVENEMCRRREREHRHQETWGGLTRYYERFDRANTKFEEWTSPRYYESNNQLISKAKKNEEKAKSLEERREKLRKLLREEEESYKIELTVCNRDKLLTPRKKLEEIPTELLKDVNLGLKLEEDDRRRHEAEINMYHQWRQNNPLVRDHERKLRNRDLKLSWLDQQIEKRMRKEREEQECRKILAEREARLQKAKEEDEQREKAKALQTARLKEELDKQIDEIRKNQEETEKLKREEAEKLRKKYQLEELEEQRRKEEIRRRNCEIALENIRHHKVKLKQKAIEIQAEIDKERELMRQFLDLQVAEAIENQQKRAELKQAAEEFIKFAKEQKELETNREKYLDFVFESELKLMYEKQSEIWEQERSARERLLKEVLDTVRVQVEDKLNRNRMEQADKLKEREHLLKMMEEQQEQMEQEMREEERRKVERKREIDEQVRAKNAMRSKLKTLEQKDIDLQLKKVSLEEQRLKNEILRLQKRQDKVVEGGSSKRVWF